MGHDSRLPLACDPVEIIDQEGRPLIEHAHGAYAAEEAPCPYRDRRAGRPMNLSALAQIRRHWRFIVSTVGGLTDGTLAGAFRASIAATTAPFVVDSVPGSWGALYKACVGFSQVFAFLLLEDAELPEADLFAWLDREGWLLGTHQVCAGSQAMIDELFKAFCTPSGEAVSIPIEHVEAALQSIALQSAMVLSTYAALRVAPGGGDSLGERLLYGGRAPWLYSVTMVPGRPPEHARRLHPCDALERFLAEERIDMTHAERERLFREVS